MTKFLFELFLLLFSVRLEVKDGLAERSVG